MQHLHMRIVMIAALAVFALSGPLTSTASAQTKATLAAMDSLKAGGKTLAGPGAYNRQANISDIVIQLTDPTNVCGTITIVSGSSVQLNLRDAANNNVQGVVATSNLRTVAGCANNITNVELVCTGGQSCKAVWRIDAR
jgi:hypothetical protein